MPELAGRDLHVVKQALAIAMLTIERSPDGPFRWNNDMADMKALLEADTELVHYGLAALIALNGRPN